MTIGKILEWTLLFVVFGMMLVDNVRYLVIYIKQRQEVRAAEQGRFSKKIGVRIILIATIIVGSTMAAKILLES